MNVSIAMTTFNGERYLSEQLSSLLEQTYLPYEIVIGDDGSTDRTLEIINKFAEDSAVPVRLIKNSTPLGFAKNFLNVASYCTGDLITFCDQDDLWLPNKIEAAVSTFESDESINVVFQNALLSNYDLTEIGRLFPNKLKSGYYESCEIPGIFIWPGFLITLKRKCFSTALDLYLVCENEVDLNWNCLKAHDYWVSILGNAIGGVFVISQVCALYRRHNSTVTGDYEKASVVEYIEKSLDVGYMSYCRYSAIAKQNEEYLLWLSSKPEMASLRSKLIYCSQEYMRLSVIYELRSKIYAYTSFSVKISSLIKIAFSGGYKTRSLIGLGRKSAVKDVYQVFFRSLLTKGL
jgi:glycosyltransferase involved in cell wall biosynthesis